MEVTSAELAVLEVLWERGTATRRELVSELYPDGRESDRATVQKLLERLERKELVNRDASRRIHQFSPLVSRHDYVGSRLDSLADAVCGGSFQPLISHLVRADKLRGEDLAELRALIDRSEAAERTRRPRKKKAGRRKS